jgi:hypothetical protein
VFNDVKGSRAAYDPTLFSAGSHAYSYGVIFLNNSSPTKSFRPVPKSTAGGRDMKPVISTIVFAGALILGSNTTIAQYKQKNLVADEKGHGIRTDPHLINGWGLAFFPDGPLLGC